MRRREPILGENGWSGLAWIAAVFGALWLWHDVINAPASADFAEDPLCIMQTWSWHESQCREYWRVRAKEAQGDPDPLGLLPPGRQ